MGKIYDSSDNLLSKTARVMPLPNPIKIEQTLLSGQLDTQIIGTAEQTYEIECTVIYADMETIKTAAANGTSIKLEHEGTTYTCYIKGNPDFGLSKRGIAANRNYEGKLLLSKIS